MVHAISLAVALVLNATANLMIRAGAKEIAAKCSGVTAVPLLTALKAGMVNPWIISGVVCFALNLAAYSYALTKLPVSMAYPIMVSVGYAIIVCGGSGVVRRKAELLANGGRGSNTGRRVAGGLGDG